jgi:hypothetical protein
MNSTSSEMFTLARNLEVYRVLGRQLLQECAVLYIHRIGMRPPSSVPTSDSSLAAEAKQSKSALSTSLLSQSAIAAAESSSTFCLFRLHCDHRHCLLPRMLVPLLLLKLTKCLQSGRRLSKLFCCSSVYSEISL